MNPAQDACRPLPIDYRRRRLHAGNAAAASQLTVVTALLILNIYGPAKCAWAEDSEKAPAGESPSLHSRVVDDPLGKRIDDFLTRMSGFGYSGNVLVTQHGKVLLEKGYGESDRSHKTPYDTDTIFDIGSMAKGFTAAAVMKLEADGRLSIDDPITKFLNDVPDDKKSISVRELLTHTSGVVSDFPYSDPSIPYEDVARDEAIRRILKAPLEFPPGKGKAYSNTGYILLAAVVERAGKMPFCDYLRHSVFRPAGLTHTGFWGDRSLDRKKVAIGYDEYGTPLHDPMARSTSTWADLGGGQILSTLDDLEHWREELASGKFLPSELVARMWTPWTKGLSARDGGYGFGWFIQQTPRQTTLIQHGGDYLGTGAELEWYRDDDVVMISSTNVRHDLYPTRNRTDRVIPKIIFGGEHPEPPAWSRNDELLKSALGEYYLPSGGSLTIHERGGHYFIGASGQDATDLLMPADETVRRRRSNLTADVQVAMDAFREDNLEPLKKLAGEASANPAFIPAVTKEIKALGHGQIQSCRVLGTFATGYPRGNPLDYETTLVQFDFEDKHASYAIRWANKAIAATEEPAFHHAADTAIQPDGKGGLVGWNIVFNIGLSIGFERKGVTVESLHFRTPTGDVVATRTRRPKT